MYSVIVFILEVFGTVAFASSGAMVAIQKKMDLLGVIVLGICTAVGGGVIRDTLIGVTPPVTFRDPVYCLIATAVSVLTFLPAVRRELTRHTAVYDRFMFWMDAIGLGVFTVIGVQAAFAAVFECNRFLAVFVGVVTGVGGGVLRDVLAQNTPYIFVKHFYACASLIGAWLCAVLWKPCGSGIAMLIGLAAVIVLRVLAAHFHWSLPKAG